MPCTCTAPRESWKRKKRKTSKEPESDFKSANQHRKAPSCENGYLLKWNLISGSFQLLDVCQLFGHGIFAIESTTWKQFDLNHVTRTRRTICVCLAVSPQGYVLIQKGLFTDTYKELWQFLTSKLCTFPLQSRDSVSNRMSSSLWKIWREHTVLHVYLWCSKQIIANLLILCQDLCQDLSQQSSTYMYMYTQLGGLVKTSALAMQRFWVRNPLEWFACVFTYVRKVLLIKWVLNKQQRKGRNKLHLECCCPNNHVLSAVLRSFSLMQSCGYTASLYRYAAETSSAVISRDRKNNK